MNQKGFTPLIIVIVIIVIGVGIGGFFLFTEKKISFSENGKTAQQKESSENIISQTKPTEPHQTAPSIKPESTPTLMPTPTTTPTTTPTPTPTPILTPTPLNASQSSPITVIWTSRDATWIPSSIPPSCPEPFVLKTPVDMSLVTSALWPGQVRGEYKAHGGFRFNNDGTNNITVRAPIGGHLIQASQYLEGGEKQYFLTFSVPCGFVYRLDHLRELTLKLKEAVKNLPPATEGDSRTNYINPPLWVEAGEIVATSIGVTKNIFVDFGLYDVRKPNNVTPNLAWADLYNADKEFGHYGVCFFDYLPGNDGAIMRALPTGKEGKVSDYCK